MVWILALIILPGAVSFAHADPHPVKPSVPAKSNSPWHKPLLLIAQAQAHYDKIKDYTCLLIKRELLDGQLTPNNAILMMVRCRPFSVYMRWKTPEELANQEVCYVTGAHDGMMRVRAAGLLGSVGFVSLPLDDPRALKASRHPITEAGIGHLIRQLTTSWLAERHLKDARVSVRNYRYAKRRCTRVEVTHPTNPQGNLRHHRTVVYFDRLNHLPIRIECYGWPASEGNSPPLVEVYSFVNLRLNVDLKDEVFQR